MSDSMYAGMRDKPRFSSDLKATYSIKEQGAQKQECRITNLSSSGASVRFPRNEDVSRKTTVAIDIPIPDTIIHVSALAEIVWVKQRFNDLLCGVRFTTGLSNTMIQRLTKSQY
jgi:hypothetical protein